MSIKQFEGIGILAFYSNGLFQGHLIKDNESPYSLAGQLLPNYKDPDYNDCMEPIDVYKVLIQSHDPAEKNIEIMLRRERNNDASGLFSIIDDDKEFSFTTNQFISGKQALSLQQKYFNNNLIPVQDHNTTTICIGPIHFHIIIQ